MAVHPFRSSQLHPAPRVSVDQAFEAQGVTLKYPTRSRSGIRTQDGMVVIAMDDADVHATGDGFSCLLWPPLVEGRVVSVDWPTKKERREHCRAAARDGSADGLLVRGEAGGVEADAVVMLRVEKRGDEYWAIWGCRARSPSLPYRALANGCAVRQ